MKKDADLAADILQSKLKMKMRYDQKLEDIHLEIQKLLDQLQKELSQFRSILEKTNQRDED